MTIAESAKTGIETTHPVIASAHSSFFLPIALINVNASCSAAPDTSRIPPIITPRPMMIPVLFSVLPNPSFIAVITPVVVTPAASVRSTTGIPPISPVRSAARRRAINVWIFVFITRTIITMIPIASPSIILVDSLIFYYLFTYLSSTRSFVSARCHLSDNAIVRKKRHKFY